KARRAEPEDDQRNDERSHQCHVALLLDGSNGGVIVSTRSDADNQKTVRLALATITPCADPPPSRVPAPRHERSSRSVCWRPLPRRRSGPSVPAAIRASTSS